MKRGYWKPISSKIRRQLWMAALAFRVRAADGTADRPRPALEDASYGGGQRRNG